MKLPNLLPPEDLKISIAGETAEKLRLILSASRTNNATWALGALAGRLLDACLAETDLDEMVVSKRPAGKRGAATLEPNGADAHD